MKAIRFNDWQGRLQSTLLRQGNGAVAINVRHAVRLLGGTDLLVDDTATLSTRWETKLRDLLSPGGIVMRELVSQNRNVLSVHSVVCKERKNWVVVPMVARPLPLYSSVYMCGDIMEMLGVHAPVSILPPRKVKYYNRARLSCPCHLERPSFRAMDIMSTGATDWFILFIFNVLHEVGVYKALCLPTKVLPTSSTSQFRTVKINRAKNPEVKVLEPQYSYRRTLHHCNKMRCILRQEGRTQHNNSLPNSPKEDVFIVLDSSCCYPPRSG